MWVHLHRVIRYFSSTWVKVFEKIFENLLKIFLYFTGFPQAHADLSTDEAKLCTGVARCCICMIRFLTFQVFT